MFLSKRKSILTVLFTLVALISNSQDRVFEGFNDADLSSWEFGGNTSATVTSGQLDLDVDVVGYNGLEFSFSAIDVRQNLEIRIKVTSTKAFTMRIDMGDQSGRYTNASPRTALIAPGTAYYTFDFDGFLGQSFPSSNQVNAGEINNILILFNPGNSFTGSVQFDDVEIGVGGESTYTTDFGIHINQIGYELKGAKSVVKESSDRSLIFTNFDIINENNEIVYTGLVNDIEAVYGWEGRFFWKMDFSDFQEEGVYRILLNGKASYPFEIKENLLFSTTAADVVGFFKQMRNLDEGDRSLPLHGGGGDVDVYGGWWDATGDPGKHMSHLSYANYFNPQQIPMVVWSLLKSYDLARTSFANEAENLKSEAAWGADYMVRQLSPEGFFYLAVFDDWGNSFNRQVCEWGQPGADNGRTANYQCAFREGGGVAIAALARAYSEGIVGEYDSDKYLQTAKTAYAHLLAPGDGYATKNLEYCNDHKENIIDNYCALLAATALYQATNEQVYLDDALTFADQLMAKQQIQGWLAADNNATRPFYHAAEEGLPVVALLELMKVTAERDEAIKLFISKLFAWYMTLNYEGVTNPFDYPREYYKPYTTALGTAKKAFFLPHDNETGYWWQGENARLASLSTSLLLASRELNDDFVLGSDSISRLALANLDWILGKNPFDVCMMSGYGYKTYPDYLNGTKKANIKGGICNGITAMDSDENNLDWAPYNNSGEYAWQNWRWIEQWLPHDAWYLLAISSIDFTSREVDCNGDENGTAYRDNCANCVGGTTGLEACIVTNNEKINEKETFLIYPNPAKDFIILRSDIKAGQWTIRNLFGMEVLSGTEKRIDLSMLASGTYLLIYQGQIKKIQKI